MNHYDLATDNHKTDYWRQLHFGMFIHYGLYSIAGGMWNGERVSHGYSEQILSHGSLDVAEYEALAQRFTADSFDPYLIARTARNAGMRYVLPVAKHHDGFCLFATETTDYDSADRGGRRDLIGELSVACRAEGLKFGFYFSLIDWHFPGATPMSDHNSDEIPDAHHQYNLRQLRELLTNYGDICEVWFDMGKPTMQQSVEMRELIGSIQPNAMISGRIWNSQEDFAVMGDNEIPGFSMARPWQTAASIYRETWGYREWQEREDVEGKIGEQVRQLATVSALGGNYLLNIGPTGEGRVVDFERQVLEGIGAWFRTHEEAVVSVDPGPWEDAAWGYSSRSDKALYLQIHEMPGDRLIPLPGLQSAPVVAYDLSASPTECRVEQAEGGFTLDLSGVAEDPYLTVIKLIFSEAPVVSGKRFKLVSGERHQVEPLVTYRYQGAEYYSLKPCEVEHSWQLEAGADSVVTLELSCSSGQVIDLCTRFPAEPAKPQKSLQTGSTLTTSVHPVA